MSLGNEFTVSGLELKSVVYKKIIFKELIATAKVDLFHLSQPEVKRYWR